MRMALFFLHAVAIENGPRDIKTEIVTKVVPVRAVKLLTGRLCKEFWCEQLGDEDIFWDRGKLLAPRHKHRNGHENCHRESCGPLNRRILHIISAQTTL